MNPGEYLVWDRSVRAFHWINFVCVLLLAFVGTAVQYTRELGISLEGNLLLKTLHAAIGYVFVLNLSWRVLWGFVGGYYARWRQLLPFGGGFLREFLGYTVSGERRNAPHYLGHSPLGRLSVTVMLLVLALLGTSGLVLAGTDLYLPPFGRAVAARIAAPGIDPADVKPHVPDAMGATEHVAMMATVDRQSYARMVADIRRPFVRVHQWSYYILLLLVTLHISAVVKAEIGGDTIISAMFSGRKSPRGWIIDFPEPSAARDPSERPDPGIARPEDTGKISG